MLQPGTPRVFLLRPSCYSHTKAVEDKTVSARVKGALSLTFVFQSAQEVHLRESYSNSSIVCPYRLDFIRALLVDSSYRLHGMSDAAALFVLPPPLLPSPRRARNASKASSVVMRTRRPTRSRRPVGFSADGDENTTTADSAALVNDVKSDSLDLGARPARPAITRDDRLREEIAHPFRRPKLVIFGTLALSATVGTLFAIGRFALGKDAPDIVALNCSINIPAVVVFGWLAKREIDFGRRALGVIAKCTEARDLPLQKPLHGSARFAAGRFGSSDVRLEVMRGRSDQDLYVLVGRARDVADVLVGAALQENDFPPVIVAVALDAGALDPTYLGPSVVCGRIGPPSERENSDRRAWEGWLSHVRRPRKSVAIFRIPRTDNARGMGEEYLARVEEPASLDLRSIVLSESSSSKKNSFDSELA